MQEIPSVQQHSEDDVARNAVRRQLRDHLDLDAFAPGRRDVDLEVGHPTGPLIVALGHLSAPRLADLRGRLAEGVLRLRRALRAGQHAAVVVVTDTFGQRSLAEAEAFMSTYAPDIGWGISDARDGLRLVVPVLDIDIDAPSTYQPPTRRETRSLFTDLNRWLAKWLLYGQLEGKPPPRNVLELHRQAGVSREKAYRFARTFESAGFLTSRRGAVVLVRLEELLDAWLTEDKLHPAERVPVRSLFGRWRRPPDTLLGGFGACKAHDVLHRSEAGLEELHVRGAVDPILEEGDLERTEPHAAQAVLMLSRHPESVFRAMPFAPEGVVDPWQAALDVASAPARGTEQARFIRDRILEQTRR